MPKRHQIEKEGLQDITRRETGLTRPSDLEPPLAACVQYGKRQEKVLERVCSAIPRIAPHPPGQPAEPVSQPARQPASPSASQLARPTPLTEPAEPLCSLLTLGARVLAVDIA